MVASERPCDQGRRWLGGGGGRHQRLASRWRNAEVMRRFYFIQTTTGMNQKKQPNEQTSFPHNPSTTGKRDLHLQERAGALDVSLLRATRLLLPFRLLTLCIVFPPRATAGTWTPLVHAPPSSSGGVMLLLTDGTVTAKSGTGGGGSSPELRNTRLPVRIHSRRSGELCYSRSSGELRYFPVSRRHLTTGLSGPEQK